MTSEHKPIAHKSVFVKVLETDSLTDIALIKSTLNAGEVEYFIQGENMKFIRPFDPAILFVTENDAQNAIDLLKPLKLNYSWIKWADGKN